MEHLENPSISCQVFEAYFCAALSLLFIEMSLIRLPIKIISSRSRLVKMKNLLADYILPFAAGFSIVIIFSWGHSVIVNAGDNNTSPTPTFQDKNGQFFLQRHGLLNEADIHRIKANKAQFGIRADAGNRFKKILVHSQTSRKFERDPDGEEGGGPPPGEIWSWPRIEEEAKEYPLVWVVTPTYRNPFQFAELTRMAQALYPARKFVRWLIVDDYTKSKNHSNHLPKLHNFLLQFGVKFRMIRSKPMPEGQKSVFNPKGVDARRTAIKYIRKMKLRGTVYFADDDNTYDSDIFRQMQGTKTVSIWPTGAITQWTVSSPVVNSSGIVVDFFDAWVANRKFPVDFASFAVNCDLLHQDPKINIPWVQGYEETVFLKMLNLSPSEFQPLAANATEVLTWHTKTVKNRAQKQIDNLLSQKSEWPESVQNLAQKYDFLFDLSAWIPVKKSKKSKRKVSSNATFSRPVLQTTTMKMKDGEAVKK